MDMTDELDDHRFAQLFHYLLDELGPDGRAEVEAWLSAEPSRAAALVQVQQFLDESGAAIAQGESDYTVDVESALAQFLAARSPMRPGVAREYAFRTRPRRRVLAAAAKIAASLVVAVGAGFLYRYYVTSGAHSAPAPVAQREYVTPRGRRAELRLVDGTRVVLSVASRLRVAPDFGARSRDVYLEGEAYFAVTHDSARRFVVHTSTASTEDLGTRFDVRAYADQRPLQVVVAEGSVALHSVAASHHSAVPPAVLTVRQLARVDSSGAITVQRAVDLNRYLAWTQGRLVFKDTPLREALPELNRWFDLDFRLGDNSLATRPLTVSIYSQLGDQMLQLLAASLDARYERHGRVVTFYPPASGR